MIYSLRYVVLWAGLKSLRFPEEAADSFNSHRDHSVCGVHPVSSQIPANFSFPREKKTDSRFYHSPECDAKFRNAWNYTWTLSP